MPGKKIRAAITSEKKNRASKVQKSWKKILAECVCIKKNRAETRDWKKNRAAKILYPPPGISNGPPLRTCYLKLIN
jgi:hypothetical protein